MDQLVQLLQQSDAALIQNIVLGIVLLALGGESLVRGAVGCATCLNMSRLFVGIAIVSIGTSAPEFGIAALSVYYDQLNIALGTAIGSNIANLLLILGIGGLISPFLISNAAIVRDGFTLVAAAGLLLFMTQQPALRLIDGTLFISALALYLFAAFVTERTDDSQAAARAADSEGGLATKSLALSFVFVAAGIIALYFGAQFIIEGTVGFAVANDLDESLLALSVVALGAALPELVAMLVGAIRRQGDLVLGTLLGSSIINILGVIGLTAVLAPDRADLGFIFFTDIAVMLAAAFILIPFMVTGRVVSRVESILLVLAYGAYIYILFSGYTLGSLF